jgi:2-dehydro-3-deoxyglucarate aldolase/4-hydroxy-2-oxoheptanedioate aldolase
MAADRDLKVGHFIVEFATPGIGQIIKAAGCDFALLDTEHSGFGYETMKSMLRYMQAAELPAIVRVPSKAYHHIARAADMGAEGIMVPMVNSAQEARQILDAMKYVPQPRSKPARAWTMPTRSPPWTGLIACGSAIST